MRFNTVIVAAVIITTALTAEVNTFETLYQDPVVSIDQQVPEGITELQEVTQASPGETRSRLGSALALETADSGSKKGKKKGCGSPVCMRWSKLKTDSAEMVMLAESSMSEEKIKRFRIRCATSASHKNGMRNGKLGQTWCHFLSTMKQRRCEKYRTSCVKLDRSMPSNAAMVSSIQSGTFVNKAHPPKSVADMRKRDGEIAATRIVTTGSGPAARIFPAGSSSRVNFGRKKAGKTAKARWMYWKNKFAWLKKQESASKASKKTTENTIKETRTKATERSIKHHQAVRSMKEKHRKADESKTKQAYSKNVARKQAKRQAAAAAEKKDKVHAAKLLAMKEIQAKTAEHLAGKKAEERLGKNKFASAKRARDKAVAAAKKQEQATKAVRAEKTLKAVEKRKKHEKSAKVAKAKERKVKEGKMKEKQSKISVAKERLEKLKVRVRLAAKRRERTRKETKEKESAAKAKVAEEKERKENGAKEKMAKEKRVKRLKRQQDEAKQAEKKLKARAAERKERSSSQSARSPAGAKERLASARRDKQRAAAAAKRAADLAKRVAAAKAAAARRAAEKAARRTCACSGATMKSATSLHGTKVGGVCALHETDDKQPWCFTKGKCVVAGKVLPLRNKKQWKNCAQKDVKRRLHWAVLLAGTGGAVMKGDIKVQFFGRQAKDKSKVFTIKSAGKGAPKRGHWLRRVFVVPKSLSWVDRVMLRYTSKTDSITIADHHVRFDGNYAISFKRGVTIGGDTDVGPDWIRLLIAKNPSPGNAKIKASMEDARTVQMLPGVLHALIAPSIVRISKKFVEAKLKALGSRIRPLNRRFKEKKITGKKLRAEVKNLLLNMLGALPQRRVNCRTAVGRVPDSDSDAAPVVQTCKSKKLNPLGILFTYQAANKAAVFNHVWEQKSIIVVSFKAGYTLDVVAVRTQMANKLVVSRSVVPPQLSKGHFLSTLVWGKKPDDLDLYVIVPKQNKAVPAAALFGTGFGNDAYGAGAHGADAVTTGKSVFWADPGKSKAYPFAKLDVDNMSGSGPETITMYKSITPGTYQFFVDCFSCHEKADYKLFHKGGAMVKIYDTTGLVTEQKISTAKLTAKGEPAKFWLVATKTCVKTKTGTSCSYKFPNKFVTTQPV